MLARRDLAAVSSDALAAKLAAWLRDDILGPAEDGMHALIRLRAVQAAMFLQGVLLRWNPTPLARCPPSNCPAPSPTGSRTGCRPCAAPNSPPPPLSLHLNHGPTYFEPLRCGDISADGSTITTPDHIDDYDLLPGTPRRGTWHRTFPVIRVRFLQDAKRELSTGTPIRLPAAAAWLFTAHLAHRRLQGANDDVPFFAHPRERHRSPTAGPAQGIRRTCETLQMPTPPWLHSGDCKFGADRGLIQRTQGWLTERCLTVHLLDPTGLPHVEHPSAYQGLEW